MWCGAGIFARTGGAIEDGSDCSRWATSAKLPVHSTSVQSPPQSRPPIQSVPENWAIRGCGAVPACTNAQIRGRTRTATDG